MQRVEQQCVPVPTLVFRGCVEAFRTASVERQSGQNLAVGGSVGHYGSARVERDQRDVKHTRFAGVAESDTEAIITECRRQEQAERDSQLAVAWEQADDERGRAEAATREARLATAAFAELQSELEEVRDGAALLQDSLQAQEAELLAMRTLVAEDHPCEVEAWDACATAAAGDHAAGDHAEAHRRYALACEAGQLDACGNWGLMFEHGLGTRPDRARADALYAEACEGDRVEACGYLGASLVVQGRSLRRAHRLLKQACDGDVGRGCSELGKLMEADPTRDEQGLQAALALYERGCELDDAGGCLALGLRYERGGDVERSVERAEQLLDKACELGETMGCQGRDRLSLLQVENPTMPSERR